MKTATTLSFDLRLHLLMKPISVDEWVERGYIKVNEADSLATCERISSDETEMVLKVSHTHYVHDIDESYICVQKYFMGVILHSRDVTILCNKCWCFCEKINRVAGKLGGR